MSVFTWHYEVGREVWSSFSNTHSFEGGVSSNVVRDYSRYKLEKPFANGGFKSKFSYLKQHFDLSGLLPSEASTLAKMSVLIPNDVANTD